MDATIRWGTTQSQPILMIPGPTELPFPVVQAMSQPATIQYDMNFDVKILEPVTLALRDIFQTSRGEVIVMPGSGRTALEAATISVIDVGQHRGEAGEHRRRELVEADAGRAADDLAHGDQ